MRPHKKLKIWEKILLFIEDIYRITSLFPKDEMFGIISQLRRASISVASNIAEGCGRTGNQEKIHFFIIARGSLSEIDAQLDISYRLKYFNNDDFNMLTVKLDEISRMLQGLIDSRRKEHVIS